jgi:hypothetical protein
MNKKKEKNPHYEQERWYKIGGVAVDAIQLLTALARIHGREMDERQLKHLARAKDSAMLTASHALRGVLSELNDEHLYWLAQDPEWRAKQAKGVKQYVAESRKAEEDE